MDNTSNPITVDAADVAASAVEAWKGRITVLQVELVDYVADTDTALVNQSNGKFLAFLNGASDLETVRTGVIGSMDGITVPLGGITNGKLCFYHR